MSSFGLIDYSTKRKNLLAEFCQFCDRVQKDNQVHECPRLNLETVVQCLLKQHEALKSYFESEEESDQDRLARLKKRFSEPMTEVYLLLYQAILSVFTSVNLMLQRTAL